ncbi:glycosyl transferase family A [Nostoc piscinale CENA21]|uniref:Glycosyl transferase family A n=1 Tax=Nostoc piscinale CENA21 TaxID=224013 RepID=A0A0M4SJU1_9NOSO|nr:glycosyltransferase [Nostoc piscinale]ALF52922.1 glycosyl transferase family A [Nostoc piscinale CENA21]
MPKVTVVIPAYNAMQFLPETVESVLAQTFSDLELLIVNDGSSDNIVQWANNITDERVKLISQENQGVSAARNTGIMQSNGEYLAFLDADDLWKPTKLEKQILRFEEYPEAGLVYTWTHLVDTFAKPINRVLASRLEGNVWKQILVANMIGNGSSAMVRRSCFQTVGLFDPELSGAADRDMWIRIAVHYPFAVVKEPLTLWRQHTNSMSKKRQEMVKDLRRTIDKNFQSVSFDLLYLQNRSYSYMNLYQAWNSIDEGNIEEAIYFRQQAYRNYPQICLTNNYIRLSLAILLIRFFGTNGYDGMRSLTRFLRWQFLNLVR